MIAEVTPDAGLTKVPLPGDATGGAVVQGNVASPRVEADLYLLLSTVVAELRALRAVVCTATAQPFLPVEPMEP